MKSLILALSAAFSVSASATSDSYVKFYYPYAHMQEDVACMGQHMFRDGISTSLEAGVRGTFTALTSRVDVTYYGQRYDMSPENVNLLVVGPGTGLFTVDSVTEEAKETYTNLDIVLDFANAGKLDKSVQDKVVKLAYYAIFKSLAHPMAYYSMILNIKNSPVSSIGNIDFTKPYPITIFGADMIKLELQKEGILALDSSCL